jgi:nucleotide-binding universal stress UspA family protein
MFHNVLLGIDGSASAAQALDRAIEIARASRGRIGLLSAVAEPSAWIALAPFALSVSRAGLRADLEAEAQRHIDEAERAVPLDVPVTKLLTRGRAADALLTQALDGPWDLIVVGAGGPLGRRAGGRLIRKSPVPVLVVQAGPGLIAAPAATRRLAGARLPSRARLHAR